MAAGSAYHHDPQDAQSIRPNAPNAGEAAGGGIALLSFAGWFLLLAGTMHAIWGLVALTQGEYFREDSLLWSTLGVWGWVGLIIALAQLIGGGALLMRSSAGAMMATLVASIGIVFNFLTIGAYPIWSVIMIVANAVVLYAITSRSDELL